MSDVPAEFRDFAFNSAEVVDVNQEIQSTDEWALKNLDYVRFLLPISFHLITIKWI